MPYKGRFFLKCSIMVNKLKFGWEAMGLTALQEALFRNLWVITPAAQGVDILGLVIRGTRILG